MQSEPNPSIAVRASLNNPLTIYTLKRLIHLNEQSERGFEAAAQHIKNRGLKIIMKTHAQQRKGFSQELSQFLEDSSDDPPAKMFRLRSLFAALHRGWLDIRAAMTIGRDAIESMMSREALRVERSIVIAEYQQALALSLAEPVAHLIESQLTQIESVVEQLELLAGKNGERLLVQLYDSNSQVNGALLNLHQLTGPTEQVEIHKVQDVMKWYACDCYGGRVLEGTSAGAIVGTALGTILTLVLGWAAMWGMGAPSVNTVTWLTIAGASFGALFGALFGSLLTHATSEDDEYIYQKSLETDAVLLFAIVPMEQVQITRSYLETMRWNQHGLATVAG